MNQECDLDLAEAAIGLEFNDKRLLRTALTHGSYSAENQAEDSNERLEFLGDSVLELIVTEELFVTNPTLLEGDLAKIRAKVVSSESLALVAKKISLGDHLFLGKGAEASGAKDQQSILENSLEALIAAVYLDKGLKTAGQFVLNLFKDVILEAVQSGGEHDLKTTLQEATVKRFNELPVYRILEEKGPMHQRRFKAQVSLKDKVLATGEGSSKKTAEQAAAKEALNLIKGDHFIFDY
ncbi:MAG: ribonuclease III [Actinomycetota bacterium]|nr:ribonuclease III [Actinomycetota bacterium]